jgi:hypothetical protein
MKHSLLKAVAPSVHRLLPFLASAWFSSNGLYSFFCNTSTGKNLLNEIAKAHLWLDAVAAKAAASAEAADRACAVGEVAIGHS